MNTDNLDIKNFKVTEEDWNLLNDLMDIYGRVLYNDPTYKTNSLIISNIIENANNLADNEKRIFEQYMNAYSTNSSFENILFYYLGLKKGLEIK